MIAQVNCPQLSTPQEVMDAVDDIFMAIPPASTKLWPRRYGQAGGLGGGGGGGGGASGLSLVQVNKEKWVGVLFVCLFVC